MIGGGELNAKSAKTAKRRIFKTFHMRAGGLGQCSNRKVKEKCGGHTPAVFYVKRAEARAPVFQLGKGSAKSGGLSRLAYNNYLLNPVLKSLVKEM